MASSPVISEIINNKNPLINNQHYVYLFFAFSYTLITLLSLSGNLFILKVILKRRFIMKVTNFFLANITIANLIYTICSPLHFIAESYGEWVFFDFACPLLPFFSTFSINLNTSSMIAASIERLIVIVHPFRPKLTKRKCILIIALIWVISITTSLPWLFILHVDNIYINNKTDSSLVDYYFNDLGFNISLNNKYDLDELIAFYSLNDEPVLEEENGIDKTLYSKTDQISVDSQETLKVLYRACLSIYSNDMIFRSYLLFLFFAQYLFPLFVLCITFATIAYYVKFSHSNTEFQCHNSYMEKNRKKLIKILVVIVVCFNICWFPLQLNAFIYAISPTYMESKISKNTAKYSWMVIHLLAFSHFCYNPFINGLLNKKFKNDISSLFKCNRVGSNKSSKTSKRCNNNNNNTANQNNCNLNKSNTFNKKRYCQAICYSGKMLRNLDIENEKAKNDKNNNSNIISINNQKLKRIDNIDESSEFLSINKHNKNTAYWNNYNKCISVDNSLFKKQIYSYKKDLHSFDENIELSKRRMIKCELNCQKSSILKPSLTSSSSQSPPYASTYSFLNFRWLNPPAELKKCSSLNHFDKHICKNLKTCTSKQNISLSQLKIRKTRKITFAFNTKREILTKNLEEGMPFERNREVSLTDSIIDLSGLNRCKTSHMTRLNSNLKRKILLKNKKSKLNNNIITSKKINSLNLLDQNNAKHSCDDHLVYSESKCYNSNNRDLFNSKMHHDSV